jgi:eukaryotic-like serine/threonine-protein kinase
MARVYRAEHSVLHKPVALKVMERALLERPDGSRRFLREGQAAAAVKHPNVVDITDVGVWNDLPYLIMELLEGDDLERHLQKHSRLSEAELAQFMLPVVAGLAAAHDSGVVHRDLKPSNIFLARDSQGGIQPKILDFGISKLSSLNEIDLSATPGDELMGSPLYMAPEAVRGSRGLTAQSDQYSLGVILYECITGRPPFEAESLLPLLEAVASGQFKPPREYRPDVSPVLEHAVLRAMSLDPQQRFQDVRHLGQALWQAAEGRTRLLWSPSFAPAQSSDSAAASHVSSPQAAGHSTPAVETHVQTESLPRLSAPPRARAYARLAALLCLLAGGFFLLRSMGETTRSAGTSPQGSAQAARGPGQPLPPPTLPGPAILPDEPTATPTPALDSKTPARHDPATEAAATRESIPAPSREARARSISEARPNPARSRTPKPRPLRASNAASTASAPESERPVFEVSPPAPLSRPASGAALGVNDSPILD